MEAGNKMLVPKSIKQKTHEELMEENLGKIPIYSNEWTNYNASDPGITMLEYLSAFQIIQQNSMNDVPDAVKSKLMELMGYKALKGTAAKVYIEPQGLEEDLYIPADQRYMVGDISFETTLPRKLSASHITGIYCKADDDRGFYDYSYILEKDLTISAAIFGKNPKQDTEIFILMDKPLDPQERGTIYAEVDNKAGRNPFSEEQKELFSVLKWECYTEEGFVEMEVEDDTYGFMVSGYIHINQPQQKAAKYKCKAFEGYVWRVVLKKSDFDIEPVVKKISGFLFPVVQKETLVITHSFQKASNISLNCTMLEEGYVRVFCKEKKGSSYRMYQQSTQGNEHGRYFIKERNGIGNYSFSFDKQKFGYAPENIKNPVKIVVYNEEMMKNYYLGEIYGYDNQEIKLPKGHIVTDTFSIIAERKLEDGSYIYDFLKPGKMKENEFSYYLYENDGKIRILDAGEYIGAKLYIGSIAVNLGEEGNVIEGNQFLPYGYSDNVRYINPAKGQGGCFQESLNDVRKRIVNDLHTPQTAVTAADYEDLVKRTPGLCISKVKAWMDYEKNEVQLAVLPKNKDKLPMLSNNYKKVIRGWIDTRRLLCTRVKICQPQYVPVLTKGVIYVKPQYENCMDEITKVIHEELNYINGNQQFGQVLRFDRLFHKIESLECVAYIDELSVNIQGTNAKMDGVDIKPSNNSLLYAGDIEIDILPELIMHQ